MKGRLPKKSVVALTLALVSCITAVLAAYWIYSTVVQVHWTPPKYELTLTGQQTGDWEITLTATLTVIHFDGSPEPVPDATVHFYLTYENGTIIEELGTATTNEYGIATCVWNFKSTEPQYSPPIETDYYFMAGYQVTP